MTRGTSLTRVKVRYRLRMAALPMLRSVAAKRVRKTAHARRSSGRRAPRRGCSVPTYTAPGVYVEEVPSSQKVLSAAPTAVAAFVGFTAKAPNDDPNDPQGLAPRLVTSWTQFESLYGGFAAGCDAAALGLRLLRQRRQRSPTSCASRTPSPSGEPARLALPAADRALGLPIAVETPRARRRHHRRQVSTSDDGRDDDDGPDAVHADRRRGWRGRRDVLRPRLRQGDAQRRHGRQRDLDEGQGRRRARRQTSTSRRSSSCSSRAPTRWRRPTPSPVPVTGRKFAGSESARTGINGLARRRGRHDGDRARPGHRRHEGGRHASTSACGRPCRRR